MREKPVYYLQYDPRWGSIMFSNHDDPGQTIASSGCGATAFAMVLATFLDPDITPADVAQVILDNDFRTDNDGVDWAFYPWAAEHYGLEFKQTTSTDEVIEALQQDVLVVASMKPGYFTRVGHFILLWALNEDNQQILVNDPNSEVRTQASYDLFREQACNYFIFYEPRGNEEMFKPKPIPVKIKIGAITIPGQYDGGVSTGPVRAIAEAMGGTVTWDEATKTVSVARTSKVTIKAGGETFPAILVDGKAYGPIRDVCEALNHRVDWYEEDKLVYII